MGKNSKISWCDHTVNFWQGCHKVSEGCKNCYMFRDKKRYGQDASVVVRSKPATFNKPLSWGDPAKVFVCSWSDFFIEEADEWRTEAYDIMQQTPHLTYLLLTKRPENIASRWGGAQSLAKNIWLGVTAENQEEANKRIPILLKTPATKRFVSIEPMLGPIDITPFLHYATIGKDSGDFENPHTGEIETIEVPVYKNSENRLDWVIVGAESGPYRRPFKIEWVRSIVEQCKVARVSVFVKQLHIDGKVSGNMEEWPEDLRIQEFPVQGNIR